MKKQILDTSCIATYKDGSTEEFASIKEASLKTGISEASIKIRCNRPGSGGKDQTTFEWANIHTKRSFQAKKSKTKGASFESEIVNALKSIGYTGCCRAAGESKKLDNNKVDIADTEHKLPVNIQCKHTQNLPNYFKIQDECTDKTKPFVLAWKKAAEGGSNSPGKVAVVPLDFFYTLLDSYTKLNSIL